MSNEITSTSIHIERVTIPNEYDMPYSTSQSWMSHMLRIPSLY